MKKLLLFMLLAGLVQANDLLGARRIPRPEEVRREDLAEERARYEAFKDQLRQEDLNRKVQEAAKREAARKAQEAKAALESKEQKEQADVKAVVEPKVAQEMEADQKSQEPVELTQEQMNTQFLKAAARGDEKRAQELLDAGVELNVANESGMTALMLAAHSNRVDMISFLLDHMKQVQEALNEQAMLVDEMFDCFAYTDAFLNAQNKNGNSAIMFAAKNSNEFIIHLLLQASGIAQMQIDLKNNDGQTYKDILEENKALRSWQQQLVGKFGKDAELLAQQLVNECAKLEELVNPMEIELSKLDKEIKELESQLHAINFAEAQRHNELSDLHVAYDDVQIWINVHRDAGFQDSDVIGTAPTTTGGEIETVSISSKEIELAELRNKIEIAEKERKNSMNESHDKLQERVTNKSAIRQELKTKVEKYRASLKALEQVLIRAKYQASADFKKDEEKKASVMSPTEADELLIVAVSSYDLNGIERALKNGANPNISISNRIPLTWLVESLNDIENTDKEEVNTILMAINCLIRMGADVNALDKEGYTPLALALEQASELLVKLLLENGANPYQEIELTEGTMVPTAISYTPLMLAVSYMNEHPDFINYFINKFGSNINAQSTDGSTALMYTIIRSFDEMGMSTTYIPEEIVKILLEHGADVNITDNEGRKFVDLITDPVLKASIQKIIADFDAYKKGVKSILDESPIVPGSGLSDHLSSIIYECLFLKK